MAESKSTTRTTNKPGEIYSAPAADRSGQTKFETKQGYVKWRKTPTGRTATIQQQKRTDRLRSKRFMKRFREGDGKEYLV